LIPSPDGDDALVWVCEPVEGFSIIIILPRKHGGEDDLTNLQALCFKCNANKGARDDQDFRTVREGINARRSDCIFCELPADRIIASNALAFSIRDNYPVAELHTLVMPTRACQAAIEWEDSSIASGTLFLESFVPESWSALCCKKLLGLRRFFLIVRISWTK
jgi:HNH endonuclease